MATDVEILARAWQMESDPRAGSRITLRGWEFHQVGHGVKRTEVERLVGEGLLEYVIRVQGQTSYRLSDKGRGFVSVTMATEPVRVNASTLMEALDLVVGYEDVKRALGVALERRNRAHFLFSGPPASGKSVILEGVRSAVPGAYMAFGSRTSGAGLSEVLFALQPPVLLLDEADKMDNATLAVLLGLMESGEVLETKSRQTRGIHLNTTVLAACNDYSRLPPEMLSRFSLHVAFPPYTKQEFVEVCCGFLGRLACPPELAPYIGHRVYDTCLGDVRKARAVWQLMEHEDRAEVERVVAFMLKYQPSEGGSRRRSRAPQAALPL